MYEYIKGRVATTGADYIVIENNGIGFKIFTSVNTMAKVKTNDSNIMIHTYL
ncbi:MAG: Holliday junction branch migration protein RuvA, partial [Clostridiales bacterium]|nr:Holliday junction branch migration protein RuvA [Clostridiales bacterium]